MYFSFGRFSGIILAASCSALAFAGGLAGPDLFPAAAMNALCLLATLGFGTSLVLIHIYVSEIKGSMQVLPASSTSPLLLNL